MKKQLLALTCALTLGVGGAVAPAAGQSVEPTGQIGYIVAKRLNASGAGEAAAAGAGGVIGAREGERLGRNIGRRLGGYRAVRGVAARAVFVRAAATGARAGAAIGAFGGFAGMVVGAAVGAA